MQKNKLYLFVKRWESKTQDLNSNKWVFYPNYFDLNFERGGKKQWKFFWLISEQ